MNETKYLRITMYDNNYINAMETAGKLLYKKFSDSRFPTEKNLPALKESFLYLLVGVQATDDIIWKENRDIPALIRSFYPHFPQLEFVDHFDIPDDDNNESIYIPMFCEAEILVR